MHGVNSSVKTPGFIVTKAILYIALLLATMVLLVSTSLWLYSQQAKKSEFLQQHQIPFIKNNAQLMKSVAELENQLVAQQLAITHQQLDQPLEDAKQAWLEIVDLSKQHVVMVNDDLRANSADEIAQTAQVFADSYKRFVILVDDLILIRQSRNGQYIANSKTIAELVERVNVLRQEKQTMLTRSSYEVVNSQNVVQKNNFQSMIGVMRYAQVYQYIYQELLKLQIQLTALSSTVSDYQFNQISTRIANVTKNINIKLQEHSEDKTLALLTKDIEAIINQLMGSGQLFAKWRDENLTTGKVIKQLNSYQIFLSQAASLIERPNFYDLPEFELSLPIIGIKVKESTMQPVGFFFILILLSTSLYLAWRLLNLVNSSYRAGIEFELQNETKAERALKKLKLKEKAKLEEELQINLQAEVGQNESTVEVVEDVDEEDNNLISYQQINELVINLEKFNQYHGSPEMAVYMLDDYMKRNKHNLQKLKAALAQNDMTEVAEINGSILKTAGLLSAPRLIKTCEQMQQACEKEDLHQAVTIIVEMNEAMDEVVSYVEEA
ncbi:Hpt domain-containing protein [Thalassotalea sp. ND16A]|uniref:Hpt domain-containing protein n=1 Tax=Thalassotalea sp. ND16A TaxID=1535422 RepID=UPI00051A0C2E|nr:Hpt domain-containing protein [Thalassotalea sp. ND16A]KGJ98101.1 hypothetical protein ND16A_0906 [Thalassotalea sp. ND16A]